MQFLSLILYLWQWASNDKHPMTFFFFLEMGLECSKYILTVESTMETKPSAEHVNINGINITVLWYKESYIYIDILSLPQHFSASLVWRWDFHQSSSEPRSNFKRISSRSGYNFAPFPPGLAAKFFPLPGELNKNAIYVIKSCLCFFCSWVRPPVVTVHYGRRYMDPAVTPTTSIPENMRLSTGRYSSVPQKIIRLCFS